MDRIPLNEKNTEKSNNVTTIGILISPIISIIINVPSYINGNMSLYNTFFLLFAMWGILSIMFIIAPPIWYLEEQIREY